MRGTPWLPALPDGWKQTQLRHVAQIRNGSDYKSVEVDEGGYPVYGSGGEFRRASDYLYDGESVLFGRKGTIDRPLHVHGKFWTVDTMFYTEIDRSRAVPRFVYYYALTMPFSMYSTSTALPSMTQGQLAGHVIPLPPLNEQRAIADYLDRETAKIDALIKKQERLIATLGERRESHVAAAVYRSQHGGSGRLKHSVIAVRQGWSPQCNSWSADGVATWGVLKAGAANAGQFRPEENKELPDDEVPRPDTVVRAGEVIVSRANTRDLVGSAAVVVGDYPRLMLCDKLYAFALDPARADPEYVTLTLGTRRWRDLIELEATGASHSMQNISQADILNIPFNPPPITEQLVLVQELRAQTERIDVVIEKAEHFIELSRERRAALITAAVTGQIDVSGAARATAASTSPSSSPGRTRTGGATCWRS